MSHERFDSSGNTEAFRAFVQAGESEPASTRIARTPIIVVAAVGAVVLLVLIVLWIAL